MKSLFIFSMLLLGISVVNAATVYIPLGSGNKVIKVDAENDTITAIYTGVANPHGLVATPDGEYLIAGSIEEEPVKKGQPADTKNSNLFFIHPAHGHVMSTIPVAGWTHHQAITSDGRFVISTHGSRGYISIVDLETNKLAFNIETGIAPNYALVAADDNKVYVTNTGSNNMVEVDLKARRVLRKMQAGSAPEHAVFSSDKKEIFVTNPRQGKISAVSVASGKVIREYKVGRNVHGLDISDDGKILFVSVKQDEKLVAVDIASGKMRSIPLSPQPYHLNTITGTGKVYVSSRSKPQIWVIDQKTLTVTNTINLPDGEGHQMAIVR